MMILLLVMILASPMSLTTSSLLQPVLPLAPFAEEGEQQQPKLTPVSALAKAGIQTSSLLSMLRPADSTTFAAGISEVLCRIRSSSVVCRLQSPRPASFCQKLAPHNPQASRALRLMKGCRFPLSKAPCRYLRMFMWRLSHWILA